MQERGLDSRCAQKAGKREQDRLLQERDQGLTRMFFRRRGLTHEQLAQERSCRPRRVSCYRSATPKSARACRRKGLRMMPHWREADIDLREKMQTDELTHQQKISQVDDYIATSAIYSDRVNNINANPDMPAEERERQLDQAETVRDQTIGAAVDEIYGD